MNKSINVAKTVAVGAVLLLAFSAVFIANAVVTLNSASLSSTTVEPGASVTVNVSVNKTGNQCQNNFGFTRVTVDGEVYESDVDSYLGEGTVSDSVSFPAPAVEGEYDVEVEIYNGVEDGVSCTEQLWASETLSLTVLTPVAPSIEVTDISPKDVTLEVGASSTITYTATVEVKGVPTSGQVQCVVFDIFRGDEWQERVVTGATTPGTYYPSWEYTNVDTYSEGEYRVVAIASQDSCETLTADPFDSATFSTEGLFAETVLKIVEAEAPGSCQLNEVSGNVWGDEDQDGEKGETELGKYEWSVMVSNEEGVYDTTSTDENGDYDFCLPNGTWTIEQVSPEGWTYSYPTDGKWVVELGLEVSASTGIFDHMFSFFIPTAHAQAAPAFNFGVFQLPTYAQGSYSNGGNGRSISLRDDSSSSDDEEETDEEDETPEGEVLGETTTVVPVGAPNTGAGGASPVSFGVHQILGILAVRKAGQVAHGK